MSKIRGPWWYLALFVALVPGALLGIVLGLSNQTLALAERGARAFGERQARRRARKAHRAYARARGVDVATLTGRDRIEAVIWANRGRPRDSEGRPLTLDDAVRRGGTVTVRLDELTVRLDETGGDR